MVEVWLKTGDRKVIADLEDTPSRLFRDAWAIEGGDSTPVVALNEDRMRPIASNLINSWRDHLNETPIKYDGYWFDTDEKSKSARNVMGAAQVATLDIIKGTNQFQVPWSTHFNQTVMMSNLDTTGLGVAMAFRTSKIYVIARKLKESIDAAQSANAIIAILQSADSHWDEPTVPNSL